MPSVLPHRSVAFASLLRWLGPWTPASATPPDVVRERWTIRPESKTERGLDAVVFRGPSEPRGLYVIAPGLHYDGPADPRFDRFCAVVAHAGFVVVAPFLPDYLAMRVATAAADDFELAVRASAVRFRDLGRPSIFSISFGSYPALTAAGRLGDAVDGTILFGGFADFAAVARFCVDGSIHHEGDEHTVAFDRSNLPALFLNLARFLVPLPYVAQLEEAYRTVCRRSWGRPERSDRTFLDALADEISPSVPEPAREAFRIGCGAESGASELVVRALAAGDHEYSMFNPLLSASAIRTPVVIVHGKDDDVIPWAEAAKLHTGLASLTATRLYLTGLFSHTGHGGFHPVLVARELATLLRLANTLANGGRLRDVVR